MVWHVPTARFSNWFYSCGKLIFIIRCILSDEAFMQWGWRIPFIASALLVFVGLYIRLKLHESPAFQNVLNKQSAVKVPLKDVLTKHIGKVVLGMLATVCTLVVFYLMTIFALNWGQPH